MFTLFAAATAALAISTAAPAAAGTETVEIRIAYGDLDLATAAGRTALERRIKRVTRKACEVVDPLDRATPRLDRACIKEARSAALAQLNTAPVRQVAMGAE
ncbi:MAG: UrcA family protein [Erythrobacter sp.]